MEEIRFTASSMSRIRFSISPLWELTNALRVLKDPEPRAYHLPWLDAVRPKLPYVDVALLTAVQPLRGYTPDFLAPLPDVPRRSVADQIAAVRATPLDIVRRELRRAAEERHGEPTPAVLRQLLTHPTLARERFAAALAAAWPLLGAPHWKRMHSLLTADISHHSAVLASGGLHALFSSLSPQMHFTGRGVRIDHSQRSGPRPARPERIHRLDNRGLVLIPSAFSWPRVQIVIEAPWQPAIYYPVRGIAVLWQPQPVSTAPELKRLLGATRALLLASLQERAATTTLANRHKLAPATVSEHLTVLARAGLLDAVRTGRTVTYQLTDLGRRLLLRDQP